MRNASKTLHPWELVLVDLMWDATEATYDRSLDRAASGAPTVADALDAAVSLADARLARAVEACHQGLGPDEWLAADSD